MRHRSKGLLAVVALERAFGNTLKGNLGSRTGLAAKAGRLLAGQLSHKPRDFGTDSRLVAALARRRPVPADLADLGVREAALAAGRPGIGAASVP